MHAPRRRQRATSRGDYPPFAVTVDVVVWTIVAGRLQVLLIERAHDPYEGAWALPGGFKRPDETLDDAAARELREETGVDAAVYLVQLGAYGDPGRDPRLDVVTVAYRAVVPVIGHARRRRPTLATPAVAGRDVLSGRLVLAFDHERILRDALDRTRTDLETTDLATAFVASRFTLSELRTAFEAVWDIELDPANFRRSLLTGRRRVCRTDRRAQPSGSGRWPPTGALHGDPRGMARRRARAPAPLTEGP